MVKFSLLAAEILEKEGISCEVINLRSIRPLDRELIVESVKKTHRIVTVEEGWPQHGVGAEIGALIMESSAFDYLDAPLERITGFDVPTPYAINIEKLAFPSVDNIVNSVRKVCYGLKKWFHNINYRLFLVIFKYFISWNAGGRIYLSRDV